MEEETVTPIEDMETLETETQTETLETETATIETDTATTETLDTLTGEMDYTEILLSIQSSVQNMETLVFYSVVVAGALFICWIIKKAIEPLLS